MTPLGLTAAAAAEEEIYNLLFVSTYALEIKDKTYIINFDEYKSIGTYWITLYVNGNKVTYFDSFGDEYAPKEI